MRKGLLVTALVLGAQHLALAGGIFYNSNQSAEYLRTFDRNSALDNADIVYYNMAATPMLKRGWTFNLSNQMIFQKATVSTIENPVLGEKSYKSSNPALLVPNAYAAYKKDDWAMFLGLETIGATAMRAWNGGLPTLDLLGKQLAGYGQTSTSGVIGGDAYANAIAQGATPAQAQAAATTAGLSPQYFPSSSTLKGASYYLAFRAGGAIQFDPDFAMAMALRFVTARQDVVGSADGYCTYDQDNHDLVNHARAVIDASSQARGLSLEWGMDYRPMPGVVLTVTYEMATKLDFKTTVHDGKDGDGLFVNGSKARLDLPQTLRLGVGWQLSPTTRLSAGLNAYLESRADLAMLNNPPYGIQAAKAYRNTYEESVSLERQLNPKWLVSFGLNLNQIGQRRDATLDTSLPGAHANYLSEGAGCQYRYSERLKLNVGLGHTAFIHPYRNADAGDDQVQAAFAGQGSLVTPEKDYNKSYLILAVGLDYHF